MDMQSGTQVQPVSSATPTPKDHGITPRDLRFGRDAGHDAGRWWLNDDPIVTAFYNASSLTFPRGEAFFIEFTAALPEGTQAA